MKIVKERGSPDSLSGLFVCQSGWDISPAA
jgi:hypothetical protein